MIVWMIRLGDLNTGLVSGHHLNKRPFNIQQMDTLSPFEYRKVHYSGDSILETSE